MQNRSKSRRQTPWDGEKNVTATQEFLRTHYQYQMDGRRKTKRFQRKSDAKAFIDSMNTAETAV